MKTLTKTAFSGAKKSIALILALLMLITTLPLTASATTTYTEGYYTYTVSDGKATIEDVNNSISGNITIPSTLGGYPVTTIGARAFYSCDSLKSITIPNSVTTIGNIAFSDCTSLTSITIPNSVTTIGGGAFYHCYSLTSITIPNSVTTIGRFAFCHCDSLTSITIPNSVTTIGDGAFYYCESLTDVYYNGSESEWNKISIGSDNAPLRNAIIHYNSGVSADAPAVRLNKSSVSLVKGDTVQLSAQPVNFSVKPGIKWSSSNKNVAAVSSTGKVTAKAKGTAVITATSTDGKASASCTVTVNTKTIPVTSFNIPSNSYTMYLGDNYQLYYSIAPYNATNKNVTWTSSDTSIVTVKNGIATAHKTGTVTVTGTTEDGKFSDSIKITVKTNVDKYSINNIDFSFDYTWFYEDSKYYNHELSKFCSAFVTVGYDMVDTEFALSALGFEDIKTYHRTGRDGEDYFIATKTFQNDGERNILIFTGYIGSNGLQWNSNFDPLATESKSKNNHYTDKRGVTHLGFDDARYFVYDDLISYVEKQQKKYSVAIDETAVLVTGHSRGGSTANLVGADLIRGATNESGFKKVANADSIYTYTYACPNNTKNSDVKSSKFNRIFNIVNPEDFVTKVLPTDWNFSRYGTTYILPSKTNESASEYNRYYKKVNATFKKIEENGSDYLPYSSGESEVYLLIKRFTAEIKNINMFYDAVNLSTLYTPFTFFQNVLCPFVNNSGNAAMAGALVNASYILTKTNLSNLYNHLTTFFFVNGTALNDTFRHAHLPDTYYAFMRAMTEQEVVEGTAKRRNSKYYEINCPVDVTVIEKESGEVVAQITDNVVNEEIAAKENALVTYVDGDTKSVWVHDPDLYEIIVTGNDDGKMDISVMTIDSDLGEIERTNYFDIPVTDTISMSTSTVIDEETGEEIDIIVDEYGEEIGTGFTLNSDELRTLTVNAEIEGIGYVDGVGDYTSGDSVTLSAVTDENNEFIGWYENDEFVSTEATFTFVVKDTVSLTAEFTDNFVELTDIKMTADESNVEEIQLDLADDENSVLLGTAFYPSNATEKAVEWTSSDENIARVNDVGIVTAKGIGTATITVTSENGEITDEITVLVTCSHSYTDEITTKPTHQEEGVRTYTCSCGDSYTEVIEKTTEHSYSEAVTAPTCTEKGYTTYTCVCGDTYIDNYVNANGHSYSSSVTTPATHLKEGVRTYTCSCGDSYTEVVEKTAEHSFKTEIIAATCTEKGFTVYSCPCGHSYKSDYTNTVNHSDNDGDTYCDYCDKYLGVEDDENQTINCSHMCHKDGFMGFIWKIIKFFSKLFGANPVCECGAQHY